MSSHPLCNIFCLVASSSYLANCASLRCSQIAYQRFTEYWLKYWCHYDPNQLLRRRVSSDLEVTLMSCSIDGASCYRNSPLRIDNFSILDWLFVSNQICLQPCRSSLSSSFFASIASARSWTTLFSWPQVCCRRRRPSPRLLGWITYYWWDYSVACHQQSIQSYLSCIKQIVSDST